jgi:hypothetical protein
LQTGQGWQAAARASWAIKSDVLINGHSFFCRKPLLRLPGTLLVGSSDRLWRLHAVVFVRTLPRLSLTHPEQLKAMS